MAYGVPLRPVRRRRGPHADARRDRLGQELHAQLPPGRGSQVRPARPDPGSGRLLPLADPVPRGALPRAVARRGGADAPAAAVRAPGGHADVPVPDGLGAPAPEARRLGSERRGHERDPLAHRGPVRVRAGAADAERLGQLASVRDVAGVEPLDPRRRLGRLLRQPGWRDAGPRVRRLAGDRPGRGGRASGSLRRGALLSARADAAWRWRIRPRRRG